MSWKRCGKKKKTKKTGSVKRTKVRGRKEKGKLRRTKVREKKEEGKAKLPAYAIGSLIAKTKEATPLLIIEDHVPGTKVTKFRILDTGTGKASPKYWTPIDLWVMDYNIVGHDCERADAEFQKLKEMRQPKSQRRPRGERPDYCENGARISLKRCMILEGPDPLVKGAKVQRKGSKVVGLKVECPSCKKKVGVVWLKSKKGYFTMRHKPKRDGFVRRKKRTKKSKGKSWRTK